MADTIVSGTSSTARTITGGNRLIVAADGVLNPSGPAVVFNLATPGLEQVVNNGSIAPVSGRAFDVTGTATSAVSIAIDNNAGASITGASDVMRVQRSLAGGTLSIDNEGSITARNGRGVNVQEYNELARFSVTNAADATFQSTDDTLRLTTATRNAAGQNVAFTGVIAITNAGTIRSTGAGSGQAIDLNDVNATETGHVTILNEASGLIESGDADAIRGGRFTLIDNFGTIRVNDATSASTGNDAIDFQANGDGTIVNHFGGRIEGARHGVTGDVAVTITNDGFIAGLHGAGINLDSAADSVTTIVNGSFAVITGISTSTDDGDAIDVDGLVDITNNGIIRAFNVAADESGPINEALAIGGGIVRNYDRIYSEERAITVDDSNLGNAFGQTTILNEGLIIGVNGEAIRITGLFGDVLVNNGLVSGSVMLGDGADTVSGSGQTIGSLFGEGGDDDIRIGGSVTGIVDGGAGNDRILGGAGGDRLAGGTGNDWIEGGRGADLLTGGAGADAFVYAAAMPGSDRILDMGSDDILVTTATLFDFNSDAIITFGRNRVLDLTGGGKVAIFDEAGNAIRALEFDGSYVAGDVQYYVYSRVGSDAGVETLKTFLPSEA